MSEYDHDRTPITEDLETILENLDHAAAREIARRYREAKGAK
jgi:hypothetical protein